MKREVLRISLILINLVKLSRILTTHWKGFVSEINHCLIYDLRTDSGTIIEYPTCQHVFSFFPLLLELKHFLFLRLD